MLEKTVFKKLLDEKGVIPVEYLVFVAAIGTILIVGTTFLFDSLKGLFGAWAGYFNAGS